MEENIHIGNGVTAMLKKNVTMELLQVNEAAITGHGNSLLSTAQVCENIVTINNTANNHNVKQHINHKKITIPMYFQNLLCTLQLHKPTEWKLNNIKPIILNSEEPW